MCQSFCSELPTSIYIPLWSLQHKKPCAMLTDAHLPSQPGLTPFEPIFEESFQHQLLLLDNLWMHDVVHCKELWDVFPGTLGTHKGVHKGPATTPCELRPGSHRGGRSGAEHLPCVMMVLGPVPGIFQDHLGKPVSVSKWAAASLGRQHWARSGSRAGSFISMHAISACRWELAGLNAPPSAKGICRRNLNWNISQFPRSGRFAEDQQAFPTPSHLTTARWLLPSPSPKPLCTVTGFGLIASLSASVIFTCKTGALVGGLWSELKGILLAGVGSFGFRSLICSDPDAAVLYTDCSSSCSRQLHPQAPFYTWFHHQ